MIGLSGAKCRILWAVALLVAVSLAACGGGDGESDSTARDITDAELTIMALSIADLGEQYAEYEVTEDSGFRTNEESAARDFDPGDEAQDLERFERIKEYERVYERPEADGASDEEGPVIVASGVQLFQDSKGASGYFADDLADLEHNIGKESEGTILEQVERFDVADIEDESAAVRLELASGDDDPVVRSYGTRVSFRRGRLVASLLVVRTDDEDIGTEVEALALRLNDRIGAVLEVAAQASPTPSQ